VKDAGMNDIATHPEHRSNRASLTDGLPADQQTELGTLSELADRLQSDPNPLPPPKARLIAQLMPLVEARQAIVPVRPSDVTTGAILGETTDPQWKLQSWISLITAQIALLEAPFWVANLSVLVLGIAIGLLSEAGTLPALFTGFSPLLVAAGVAYAFRSETEGLRELERISPITTLELLYARLIPVLLTNALIILVFVSLSWARMPEISLWRVILTWLGLMLGMTGLALYTTVRWGSMAGMAAPILVWVGLIAAVEQQVTGRSFDLTITAQWLWTLISTSDNGLILSAVSLVIGIILFWQAERTLSTKSGARV